MKNYNFSIFGSIVWLLTLTIGVSLLLSVPISILSLFSNDLKLSDNFFPPIIEFCYVLLNLIVILKLLPHTISHKISPDSTLGFLGFRKVTLKTSIAVLFISLFYFTVESYLLNEVFKQPLPESMIQLRNSTDGLFNHLLIFISIGLLGPIIEEIIFRGVLLERLIFSTVGSIGAIGISSLTFALFHFHYSPIQMFSIFAFGVFLGLVKLKTSNIVYPIAIHSLGNTIALLYLFS